MGGGGASVSQVLYAVSRRHGASNRVDEQLKQTFDEACHRHPSVHSLCDDPPFGALFGVHCAVGIHAVVCVGWSVHRRGSGGGRKQADTDGSGALDAEELSGVVTKLQLYMTAEDWVRIQRLEYAVFSDGVFKMSMSTRLHA